VLFVVSFIGSFIGLFIVLFSVSFIVAFIVLFIVSLRYSRLVCCSRFLGGGLLVLEIFKMVVVAVSERNGG
jgi:hypothetical protein